MDAMILAKTLPSGKFWTEELPDGAVEQSTGSFGYDFGQKVLNIKIRGGADNLRLAIAYIVGYSEVLPKFSALQFGIQGPYTLHRNIPARHPQLSGLRATKILSCTGKGLDRTGPKRMASGTAGNWEYTYLSILFEIPKYAIMSDTDLAFRPEYMRYTIWDYEQNLETLARKGQNWMAVAQQAQAITPSYAGDRTIRQPKGVLKITTYDVHEDYVKLGRLIPVNFEQRTSTLNARLFPAESYFDQNKDPDDEVLVQYKPGTLLLLPTKITSHTQNHPAVLNGFVGPEFFPRTVDIECSMLHFDPDTDDETFVNLSDPIYGFDPGDAATTLVRGHQLAPMPAPSGSGYIWYTYVNNATSFKNAHSYSKNGFRHACLYDGRYYSCMAVANTVPPTAFPPDPGVWKEGIEKPLALLYPYSDYEKLWAPVESPP